MCDQPCYPMINKLTTNAYAWTWYGLARISETREDTCRDGSCNSRAKNHDAAMNSVCSHTPRLHTEVNYLRSYELLRWAVTTSIFCHRGRPSNHVPTTHRSVGAAQQRSLSNWHRQQPAEPQRVLIGQTASLRPRDRGGLLHDVVRLKTHDHEQRQMPYESHDAAMNSV